MLQQRLPLPAYDHLLKLSHAFNILDARGAVSRRAAPVAGLVLEGRLQTPWRQGWLGLPSAFPLHANAQVGVTERANSFAALRMLARQTTGAAWRPGWHGFFVMAGCS